MSATYTHHPKAPTGQALDQEAPTSHTTPPAFKHTGTRSIRSSLSKAAAPKHLNLDNSLGFQYSGLSPEVPGQQLCHGEGQLNFGVRPPPSPSAIHPSYGLDHASKNVTNAWSGSRPQAPDNPTDRPSSPSESNNSSTFDETVDLQSSQSGSVNSSAHYASARFSPLHQSVSRSPKVSQHSPIAVYKDKPKSAGLLSKSLFQSQNLQQTKTPFEESALGAFLSKPAVAKVLDSPTAWIFYYFILNLGLTLYNKLVLVKFPFPFTVTGIHCLCGAMGCYLLQKQGVFQSSSLSRREFGVLVSFSFLYTINISLSNISLRLVTVPFHQVVRATTPLFTIILNYMFLSKQTAPQVYASLIPVVAGVGLATYGDYYYTFLGLFLTALGAFLAAVKGIATNTLLVGRLRLHPLDLLLRMSPLAFAQCVLYAWAGGELAAVREFSATKMTRSSFLGLLFNGIFAFGLNVVSFSANKKTSALTMTVAANVKQVLTILWAVWLFDVSLNITNSMGIFLTLIGGAAYAAANHMVKRDRQKARDSNAGLSPHLEVPMHEEKR